MDKTVVDGRNSVSVIGGVLSVSNGQATPARIEIGPTAITVGRSAGCNVVLADRHVSSLHCELQATEDGVRVRDRSSRNGTFINGAQVFDAVLPREGILRCGETELSLGSRDRHAKIDISEHNHFRGLVGSSTAMRAIFPTLEKLARKNLSVLICGETGSGKEAVARAIHEASPARRDKPFEVIDCTTLPPALAESILFGHERGAFTGAHEKRLSPFIRAGEGTVFIDEIGDLPLELQSKLLRILSEKKVMSVGGEEYVPIRARILAATRRDLPAEMNRKAFRDDLYFRVKELQITIPPLRNRREDIPALIHHIARENGLKRPQSRIDPADLERLMAHDWPGNVRELRSVVISAIGMAEEHGFLPLRAQLSQFNAVPAERGSAMFTHDSAGRRLSYKAAKKALAAAYFTSLFEETHGHLTNMATVAGITRTAVALQVDKIGILRRRNERRES